MKFYNLIFLKKLGLCLGLGIILSSCMSDEVILEGERINVTNANLVITDEFKASGKPSIGRATRLSNWSQGSGTLSNNPGNLVINAENPKNPVWTVDIGVSSDGRLRGGNNLRLAARPLVYQDRVLTYEHNARIISFNLETGARFWETSLKPKEEDGAGLGGGIAADRGRIFVATGYGELAALNLETGEVIWRQELTAPARSSPAAGNGMVFVVLQSNEVVAVNQSDGSELWIYAGVPENAGLLAESNPAITGDKVVVPFTSGEVMSIDVSTGEPDWVDTVSKPFKTLAVSGISDVAASPVVSNGDVIATSVAGQTISIDLETGERNWERNIGGAHTPIVSGNAVFIVDLDDRLIALNRENGKTFWVTQLTVDKGDSNRATWSGPLLGNGSLYAVSSEGLLAKINPADGEIETETVVAENSYIAPVTANGYLIVVNLSGLTVIQ